MYGHPGKKLLFMGQEFAQTSEWNHEESLPWHLLEQSSHNQIQQWLSDLNRFYQSEPALYENEFHPDGFEWVEYTDWESGVISFIRKSKSGQDFILVICNFTPVVRRDYRVGVTLDGFWKELLNSDDKKYGGSGLGNGGGLQSSATPSHGREHSLALTIPPLAVLFFKQK